MSTDQIITLVVWGVLLAAAHCLIWWFDAKKKKKKRLELAEKQRQAEEAKENINESSDSE